MDEHRLKTFRESVRSIAWFSNAGEPCDDARVVHGLQSAWDREGERTLDIWGRETHVLEAQALASLGGQGIDQIFSAVSDAIEEPLYNGLCNYLARVYDTIHEAKKRTLDDGVFPEVLELAKRDVCWAGVEHALHSQGFFSNLLRVGELADVKARRERLQQALDEARAADEARKRKGTDPEKNAAQIPIADTDSRVMPNKEGGYVPNYTPTAVTDGHPTLLLDESGSGKHFPTRQKSFAILSSRWLAMRRERGRRS